MANTLAEVVQLQRSEEQANGVRVRWELRTEITRSRSGPRLVRIQVMVPETIAALMAEHGPTSVVGRRIIERWAMAVSGR
jgi:hypothetical protein